MVVPLGHVESQVSAGVVQFVGAGLLAVSSSIFAVYALRNRQLDRLESQRPFWRYLTLLGVAGTTHGLTGMLGAAVHARSLVALSHAALLFATVFLAFAMRELYYNSVLAPPPEDRDVSLARLRRIETGFVGVILVELVVVLLIDQGAVAALVKGAGSLAFATYGVVFAERLESSTRGTSVDTLRRHLVPVLVCAGLLGVADLATLFGVGHVVARSVQSVFVVMVGAFLLTASIRLQQNVHGLSTPE
ncbi:hypothetical protein DMJ13_11925 [halophilic archaeon]|nr:hypothetical protein DMJ13_11925 [halophilic archaeon]